MKISNVKKTEKWSLQKGTVVKMSIFYLFTFIVCLSCIGCIKANDTNNKVKSEDTTSVSDTPAITTSQDNSIEKQTSPNDMEVAKAAPVMEAVDYTDCFDNFKGCAVFFNSTKNTYYMYNQELCKEQSSPYSTFKIISTLMGLETGVLNSINTTMGYDGTKYSNEKWNRDLNLKDAFKESCVWYYRKVIDRVGQSEVQNWLDQLDYGNCDISEWEGSGANSMPALNGFWLESSLKISPKEQVDIMAMIFEGKSNFSERNINILKEVMLIQKDERLSIYGKTGSGKNGKGWFVGMFDENGERYFFAVHLTEENRKDSWGPKAKEIALNIIDKYYSEP